MFAKLAVAFISLSTVLSGAFAAPMTPRNDFISLEQWGRGFDGFFGPDNFDNSRFSPVFVQGRPDLVCRSHDIAITQQRLAVLHELTRRVISELNCEVETQVILLEQFRATNRVFAHHIRRLAPQVTIGFDEHISSHINRFFLPDGSLSTERWNFIGTDVGRHFVRVTGDNWVDATSPQVVDLAFQTCHNSRVATSLFH